MLRLGGGRGGVLLQVGNGTDLVDFPREALTSLGRRKVGWGKGGRARREEGEETGIGM